MPLNAQHKRIRKNRVSITYDVETGDSQEQRELPFVVGVTGNFSGDKTEDQLEPFEDREFIQVDHDNFDEVMSRIGPQLNMRVENVLSNDPETSDMQIGLKFNRMQDFTPDELVNQIEPLKVLVNIRNQLRVLLSKADRSTDFERLICKILKDDESVKRLAGELGIEPPQLAAPKEEKPAKEKGTTTK